MTPQVMVGPRCAALFSRLQLGLVLRVIITDFGSKFAALHS